MFLRSVCEDPRYRDAVSKLHKDFHNKINNYPESIEAAVALLKNHEVNSNPRFGRRGVSFAQLDDEANDGDYESTEEPEPHPNTRRAFGMD